MNNTELANKYSAYGFALTDLNLYLDSHPDDGEALARFAEIKSQYEVLRKQYTEQIGPLKITDVSGETEWTWIGDPWPWEREGECS